MQFSSSCPVSDQEVSSLTFWGIIGQLNVSLALSESANTKLSDQETFLRVTLLEDELLYLGLDFPSKPM